MLNLIAKGKTSFLKDVKSSKEVEDRYLQKLNIQNKKPILIVSNPLSIEGVLIKLFESKMPVFIEPIFDSDNLKENRKMLKSALSGIFYPDSEEEYYKKHLSKDFILKKAKEINELKLLLSIFNILL